MAGASWPPLQDLLNTTTIRYYFFRYQPCPISIAHFLEFGRNASLESSFLFLRREVPVRIANIMKVSKHLKYLTSRLVINIISYTYLPTPVDFKTLPVDLRNFLAL